MSVDCIQQKKTTTNFDNLVPVNFENCKELNNFNHSEVISKLRLVSQLFFRVVNF